MANKKVHWRAMPRRFGREGSPDTMCGHYGTTTNILKRVTCKTCIRILKKAGKEIPGPMPDLHLYSPSFSLRHGANGKAQLVITTVPKDPDDLRPFMDLVLERGYDYILPPAVAKEVNKETAKKKVAKKKVVKRKNVGKRAIGGRRRRTFVPVVYR